MQQQTKMTTLQEILYLVAYNGYAEDIRQSVAVSMETWTDERIWQPFLMNLRFGPKKKGRIQIIAERTGSYNYDKTFMSKFEEHKKIAEISHHMKRFREQINMRDTDGETALTVAIKRRRPDMLKFLVDNGADVNQTNNKGRSALNLAKKMYEIEDKEEIKLINKYSGMRGYTSAIQSNSEQIVSYLTSLGAIDIPGEVSRYIYNEDRMLIHKQNFLNLRVRNT
jgi:ankyrin repeat protein